jgi:hypothetical protein
MKTHCCELPETYAITRSEPARGSLHVPAETVRNDFNKLILEWGDVGDLAVGLAEVVPHRDSMNEPVLGTHEAENAALELQRPDHLQGVERELLEEFAIALLDRGARPPGPRPNRGCWAGTASAFRRPRT